jgi:hypothetical protein
MKKYKLGDQIDNFIDKLPCLRTTLQKLVKKKLENSIN